LQRSPTRLPASVLAAYGGPVFAVAYLLFFVQFYFLKFATDVLLLSPAVVSLLFGAAKLWDGVSGPLIGSFSDRTRTRWGRRRPFLIGSLPLLAFGFVMLWMAPRSLGGGGLIVWLGVALFLFFSAFDLYTLPHMALGAELSPDSHQRTRLFGVRQMSFTIGILLAFGGIQFAMNAEDGRAAAAWLAIPGAVVATLLLAVTPLALREPEHAETSGGRGLVASFRDVVSTSAARRLLGVQFVDAAGVGAVGTMAPFIAEYLLRRPDAVGILPAAYVISGVVTIPLWVLISRRFGARETWMRAMLLAAAAFAGIWFVGPGDLALLLCLLVVAGSAMGCGGVLSNALLADVIDLDARRTGERKEGAYSAAMLLALKVGAALALGASGPVMSAAGFTPNVEQTETGLLGLRILFSAMPCLGFLLGAWLFRGFSLDGDGPPAIVVAPIVPQPSSRRAT
jgi:GPH family glycoside/pentoside/hexuronide:cation symporter